MHNNWEDLKMGGRSPRTRFPELHIKPFEQFEGFRTFTNFIEPLLPKKRTEQPWFLRHIRHTYKQKPFFVQSLYTSTRSFTIPRNPTIFTLKITQVCTPNTKIHMHTLTYIIVHGNIPAFHSLSYLFTKHRGQRCSHACLLPPSPAWLTSACAHRQ
jgi:hypothetical protein